MTVYGYSRVSTNFQATEGESLEVQQRQIAGYCMMQGLDAPVMLVESGVSGSVPLGSRPEGSTLLGLLRKGDTVIASKLDRMFRNALDALQTAESFEKRGISLVLLDVGGDVTKGATGRLYFTIVAAFADAERRRIGERVSQSKADAKARGMYTGGKVELGKRVNAAGELEDCPEGQAVIATVAELHKAGLSYRKIIPQVAAKHGRTLALNTVMRVVQGL